MKKLILVTGPRSSGTRFFTDLLIRCGASGDGGHSQRMDALSGWDSGFKPPCSDREALMMIQGAGYAVLRRSLPHGMGWPVLKAEVDWFSLRYGCDYAGAFWMQRDVYATCRSMVATGHELDIDTALASVQAAFTKIPTFGKIIPVTYERLDDPLYVQYILDMMGVFLLSPDHTEFQNANSKHYA